MSAPLDVRRGWDVIIIGGRVAGASTALLLARAGLRVLVVERARRGSDTLSTHALMRGGVLQLHRWGLLDRVAATGAPPVRRVTFHYGHDSMPVTLKPYAGVDALYAPRRTVLDALLVGAAEEAGARFGFGLVMTDVARDRAGRVIGVVVRDHLGATWTERAGLVVGADGRTSLVARQVGAPTVVAGSHAAAYVYGYWPAADLDGYHWYYGDGLSAGVIPTNDGLACVFAAGPAAVLAARMRHSRPLDAARDLLARLDCRLTDLTRARRWARSDSSAACQPDCDAPLDRAGRWSGMPGRGRIRCPPTESPTRSAMPSCWPGPSSQVPRRTTRCGSPSAATRPNGTAGRCRCIRSSTGSPPISGTWPKSNSCSASFPR